MLIKAGMVALALALGSTAAVTSGASYDDGHSAQVTAALTVRLPKTQVTAIDCSKVEGLCEVTAGENLFYVDRSARFLVIGRIYDMETRQDLTAARLLAMNPDMLLGSAARANAAASEPEAAPMMKVAGTEPRPGASARVDVSKLSRKGAIVWGHGRQAVTVFSDFHCGYCRALNQALRTMDVTVYERPISILGSREVADQVICSANREAAVARAYAREPVEAQGQCDTSGLDENERFARAHGFSGTPVIVRGDGAVLEGYRPKEQLIAWLKESRS